MLISAEKRREIIARYARLKPNGQPQFCEPTKAEKRTDPNAAAPAPPVIYPDRAAAEAASAEFAANGGFHLAVRECHRSRSGHFHLYQESE